MPQTRNIWLKEEDDIILEFVITQGLKKWTKIAKTIKERLGIDTRTGKQCRERWNNNLNPCITKETWSEEEVLKVFELQEQLGNKWSEIASHLPGRTDNSIKNCFYSSIRKNLRKFNRKKPESEKLKGSLKSLLKKPYSRAVLMDQSAKNLEILNTKNEENEVDNEGTPNEIVCPVVSPLNPIEIFTVPFTANTTPRPALNECKGFFKIRDEDTYLVDYHHGLVNEGLAFDNFTPVYIFNQVSPFGNMEFFFTPRNSGSN